MFNKFGDEPDVDTVRFKISALDHPFHNRMNRMKRRGLLLNSIESGWNRQDQLMSRKDIQSGHRPNLPESTGSSLFQDPRSPVEDILLDITVSVVNWDIGAD